MRSGPRKRTGSAAETKGKGIGKEKEKSGHVRERAELGSFGGYKYKLLNPVIFLGGSLE